MLLSYGYRVATTILGQALQPRVALFDPVRLSMRVSPADVDPYLHLNNGRYLTLMDIGRYQMALRTGMFQMMWRRQWWPVLGTAVIQYRRELRLFERFDLVTRFTTWHGKWFFVEQRFEKDGHLYADAIVRGVFRYRGRSIPCGEVVTALGYHGGPPEHPPVDWPASLRPLRAAG